MARILLSAAANRPWSPGHSLRPALERTGHSVHTFDYLSSEDPLRELLETVDHVKPDLHFVYGGELYPPDLIQKLRSRNIPQVLWFPEVVLQVPPQLVELGRSYDLFLTIADGLVERFTAAGIPNVAWLPEALEPSVYAYDTVSDLDRALFACQVTLVGKLESDNPAYLERWKLVKRLVDENFSVKWWGPRIRRRIGTFVLGLLLSKVSRAYGGRFVWNETYAKAIHFSKIFIAREAYPHVRLSMSSRFYTALGLGAFYLTFPTRGMEELFVPEKEYVTFLTADEMVDKIRYYLDHDAERTAIARAGEAKTLASHTYQHRFLRLFQLLAERNIKLP